MNYLLNFNDYINESENNFIKPYMDNETVSPKSELINLTDTLTLVCVSVNKRNTNEVIHVRKACEANGIEFIYANFEDPTTTTSREGDDCILNTNGESYKLSKDKTIILKRHARMSNHEVHEKFSVFVKCNFLTINSKEAIATCRNKVSTANILSQYGVSQPKYVTFDSNNIGNFNQIMEDADFTYPVIAKVNKGSQGNGVFIFDSLQSLKGVAQYIISKSDLLVSDAIIVQEKIESDYDLRLHVLRKEKSVTLTPNDKYIVYAAMRRNKMTGDYRSNVSLGADYEPHTPKEDEIALAIEAAKASGCIACGVDIMRDKNTGKLYVIEINSTPSLDGISRVNNNDPATIFIKALKEEFEGGASLTEKREKRMGYRETFYIEGFDKPLVAFIDSGNTSYTTILAEDVNVDKDKGTVSWTLHGKKFVTKYDGDTKFIAAGGRLISQPTTKINLIHDGETFKNVKIKLSDRSNRKKVTRDMNVGLKLLTKMNAVIVPSEKYIND